MKKNEVISILRRASYRLKPRSDALKEGRVGRNQYICTECGPTKIHPRKDINLDHRIPVVGPEGFTSFDDFISRLYCEKEGYQILCIHHHDIKTKRENDERALIKNNVIKIKNLLDTEYQLFVQYLIDRFGMDSVKSYLENKEEMNAGKTEE